MEEPSLGELMRALEKLEAQCERWAQQQQQQLSEAISSMVRRDVYVVEYKRLEDAIQEGQRRHGERVGALEQEIAEIKVGRDQRDARMRQNQQLAWTSLAAPVLVGFILLAFQLVSGS